MQSDKNNQHVTKSEFKKGIKQLDRKIDHLGDTTKRLDEKIEASTKRLDEKIDISTKKLDDKINKVALGLAATQADVREIKHTMATSMATKSDVDRIMNAIDAFARKAETYDRKALSHGEILQNHETKIQDHDRRLKAIESNP